VNVGKVKRAHHDAFSSSSCRSSLDGVEQIQVTIVTLSSLALSLVLLSSAIFSLSLSVSLFESLAITEALRLEGDVLNNLKPLTPDFLSDFGNRYTQ